MKISIGFFLFLTCFSLVNMHIFRNLTPLYLIFLGVEYIFTIGYSLYLIKSVKLDLINISILVYCFTGAISAGYTIVDYGLSSGLYAFTRYFLSFPLAVVAYATIRNERQMGILLKYFVFMIAIGSITVPLQFIIGPISWFSEPGRRIGLIRYASAFGSLNPIGIVAPMGFFLLLSLNISKYWKILLGVMLTSGMILSLQKSALMGFVVSILIYLLVFPNRIKLKNIGTFLVGILVIISSLVYVSRESDLPIVNALNYMYASTGIEYDQNESYRGGDDTVIESIVRRLTELPGNSLEDLYQKTDLLGYAVGGGFDMMGVALMMENETEYIAPHNNLVDFIVIGGIYHLLSFFGILFGVIATVRSNVNTFKVERRSDDLYRVIYGFLILYVVNLPFTSGMNFHPNISCMFWVIVGFVSRQNLEWRRIHSAAV